MLRNIASNWALHAVQVAVFLVISPYVVAALGKPLFGVWSTMVALTGFLQLVLLGTPIASVRLIVEHVASGDVRGTNAAIATCAVTVAAVGAGVLVAGAGLFWLVEVTYVDGAGWLAVADATDARLAFAVIVVQIAVGFLATLPKAIFDAHQDFVAKNAVLAGSLALKLGLVLVLLDLRPSLLALASVVACCAVFELVALLALLKLRHPEMRVGLRGWQRTGLRRVASYSVFATLFALGARLAFQSDALVISQLGDATAVTLYDIGNKIFEPLLGFMPAIGSVVMPAATALDRIGERPQLQAMFLRWSKIAFSLVLAIAVFVVVLGREFLRWWFGAMYEEVSGDVLVVLMISYVLFLPVYAVAAPVLLGLNRQRRLAATMLAMGIANVALSVALFRPLGLVGVALGTAVPNVVAAVAVLRQACAAVDVPFLRYAGYVFGRALAGAAVPAALLLAWQLGPGVHGSGLLVAGPGLLLLFGFTWWSFVFRNDPYIDVAALLRPRRSGA